MSKGSEVLDPVVARAMLEKLKCPLFSFTWNLTPTNQLQQRHTAVVAGLAGLRSPRRVRLGKRQLIAQTTAAEMGPWYDDYNKEVACPS